MVEGIDQVLFRRTKDIIPKKSNKKYLRKIKNLNSSNNN